MPVTVDRSAIQESVFAAIEEFNQQLAFHQQVPLKEQTQLFGKGASLDSLGLVNLIVSVESRLADDFGVSITLADEKAMSRQHSPFRSVGSLIDYATELLTEAS